jgi:sec-independent protein translocase protein TatC
MAVFDDEARMTFVEHLTELRTRLIRSVIAVCISVVLCYFVADKIFYLVAHPLMPSSTTAKVAPPQVGQEGVVPNTASLPAGATPPAPAAPETRPIQWTTLTPLEGFVVQLKLSVFAGLLLVLPYLVWHIMAFIFPGLKPNERKLIMILCGGGFSLAVFGVTVSYFGVLPLVLPYLLSFTPEGVITQLRMNDTVIMVLWFYLGFAIAFQFPMVVLVLVYVGLVTPEMLRKYRRMAIVVIAIVSALLTPPDPISMTVMMVPLVILYEISIWVSYIVIRKRKAAAVTTTSTDITPVE